MKRNVSVVCVCSAPNCCDTEQRSAKQPASQPASQPVSCLTRLSADLSVIWLRVPPDYFLWGYLKGRVCQNKPRTIDALKANITE